MVLTWVAGATNAERAIKTIKQSNNQKLHQDFDLETFKHFFDDDAWASVASLGNHLIPMLHVGWVN